MKRQIEDSELILNEDGSIYHLHLLPEHVASDIIFVGDQDRVKEVSKHFDSIEVQINKREFVTHTGRIGNKRITVISTGIGTDNIDIVFNELDALFNIDLNTRTIKDKLESFRVVRVGTSGCLQEDIPIDSILLSEYGLGLDGLMGFYHLSNSQSELDMLNQIKNDVELPITPSLSECGRNLYHHFQDDGIFSGITISATGFYGPQGRRLRLAPKIENFIDELAAINLNNTHITNLEMETSAIYGFGKMLGHQCLSVNAILANRQSKTFSKNPKAIVEKAIIYALDKLVSL